MKSRSETIHIAPDCPAEIDRKIRADAAARGIQVMPAQPFPWNRKATDEKTVAERRWNAPTRAPKPQAPCDIGLFSDNAAQADLVDIARKR